MLSVSEAAAKFDLTTSTVHARSTRNKWKVIGAWEKKRRAKIAAATAAEIKQNGVNWSARAEKHRDLSFTIAHESMKRFKPRRPQNWRELDLADKIARRSAELDMDDNTQSQMLLVNINERCEEHAQDIARREIIDVTVLDDAESPGAPVSVLQEAVSPNES